MTCAKRLRGFQTELTTFTLSCNYKPTWKRPKVKPAAGGWTLLPP